MVTTLNYLSYDLDVHLEELNEIRGLGHGLLKLRKAESAVFIVVALAKNVFDDTQLLLARQVLVVVEDQPVDNFADVIATCKQTKISLRNFYK